MSQTRIILCDGCGRREEAGFSDFSLIDKVVVAVRWRETDPRRPETEGQDCVDEWIDLCPVCYETLARRVEALVCETVKRAV